MSITHSANVGTVSDCRYILNHSSLAIIQLGGENMSDHESKEFGLYYEDGVCYVFFWSKFKRAFNEMAKNEGKTQSEMIGWIYEKLDIPEDTVRNHLRSRTQKKGPTLPKEIADIKKYGAVLANNEYEFLLKLTDDTLEDKAEDQSRAAKTVFDMLYDLLAQYEASDGFNRIPGADNSEGAWSYFENEIDRVRKELETLFLGDRESADREKLETIINETECFIKSYSIPGVVKRWREINPLINFFDCAFEIIDECGMETVRLLHRKGLLDYLPSDFLIEERKKYFAERKNANVKGNLQYSETRFFQNELLRTLAMVFDKDFNKKDDRSHIL